MSVEKIVQLERSKRRVLLGALVVIAGVALYRWILSPYSVHLLAAQYYKSTLDNAMHKTEVLGMTLRAKREKVGELTEEFDRRQNELFTPDEIQKFFGSLQTIARRAGCTVQSVTSVTEGRRGSQDQQKDASGIVGKKTVIVVSGGYSDITKFIGEVQGYQHKIWIESFKLDTGGKAGKLKCQVVLTLYCIERVEATLL
jgi:Tfp pilus assembly protein PilO